MSESDKLRRQVATLATFGGHALRSGEIGELLQEATQLVSDAIGGRPRKSAPTPSRRPKPIGARRCELASRCSGSCDHFDRRRFGSRTCRADQSTCRFRCRHRKAIPHAAVETHECRNRDTGTSAKCEKKRPPVSGLLRVLCIFSTTKACCNNRTPPYHGSGQTNPSQCYD